MGNITKKLFGYSEDKPVYQYTLENGSKVQVDIITYGGAVRSIRIPRAEGQVDVVLGYDSIEDYKRHDKYMGAIIGRVSNRIEAGKFLLNNEKYSLYCNNGPNHLHGGKVGFDKKVWEVTEDKTKLCLSYYSRDGEEGYPGNLLTKVCYKLEENNSLIIDMSAKSDQDTVVSITNHCYFNLSGHNAGDILNHYLEIFANTYTPIDEFGIPTGKIEDVEGTPFDFSKGQIIGQRIFENNVQLKNGAGYDHNYVVGDKSKNKYKLKLVAKACDIQSKIGMEVYTTQPGIQFYSGNFLDQAVLGKKGVVYDRHSGFCLEAQGFPDAVNVSDFPSPILKREKTYNQTIKYKFLFE